MAAGSQADLTHPWNNGQRAWKNGSAARMAGLPDAWPRGVRQASGRLAACALPIALAACGFPKPADVAGDAGMGMSADAPVDGTDSGVPGTVVRVSPAGDDGNDGLTQPVRTLKQAIAIVSGNSALTQIALDTGSYTLASGEAFPYTIPVGLTISGPTSGGAVLVGDNTVDGLKLDAGQLQNLELDNFGVAISITGQVGLKQVQIKNSTQAVREQMAAKLTVDQLDIVGSVDACGAGIKMDAMTALTASTLSTSNLTSTIDAAGANVINVSKANVTGDPRCDCFGFKVSPGDQLDLEDSVVVSCRISLSITGSMSVATQVTLNNTTLRNAENMVSSEFPLTFKMTGGSLLNATKAAAGFFGGSAAFVNVTMTGSTGAGVSMLGGPTVGTASVSMRGCTVSNNGIAVQFLDTSAGDLGTDATPGNNVFQNNQMVGVSVQGAMGPQQVDAVGNTWNASVQGANAVGLYPTATTVSGPVTSVAFNNYDIASGLSLRR